MITVDRNSLPRYAVYDDPTKYIKDSLADIEARPYAERKVARRALAIDVAYQGNNDLIAARDIQDCLSSAGLQGRLLHNEILRVNDLKADTLNEAVEREHARREAKRILDAEEAASVPHVGFDQGTLGEILAREPEPPFRVDGLIPSDAGTLIVAQRKTGKTHLVLNLAYSLITGKDFLGRFPVRPIEGGRVALLNFEVSAAQIARWADQHGLDHDALYVVTLRGRRNPLSHPEDRKSLAGWLNEAYTDALIVDPFGRAYTGRSQNDSGEVGAWLADLDVFARQEVGASDLILTAHAGWQNERSRGASALEDWADSIVTLVKDDDDVRYLKAIGRDVDVDEDRLDYEPTTRALTMAGTGSRRKAKADHKLEGLMVDAVQLVSANHGWSAADVARAWRAAGVAFQRGDEHKAVNLAIERGHLRSEKGSRNARLLYPTVVNDPNNPNHPNGVFGVTPTTPYMGGVTPGILDESMTPEGKAA